MRHYTDSNKRQWRLIASIDGINVDYEEIIESEEEPDFWTCEIIAEDHMCDFWYIEELEIA